MKSIAALEKEVVMPTNTMSLWAQKKFIYMEAKRCLRLRIYCDMNDPRAMKRNIEMMPAGDFKLLGYNWKAE